MDLTFLERIAEGGPYRYWERLNKFFLYNSSFAIHTDSSADVLERFHVFASLNGERVKGRAFNAVDGEAFAWRDLWPRLAAYFGIVGTGPGKGKKGSVKEYVHGRKGEWEG